MKKKIIIGLEIILIIMEVGFLVIGNKEEEVKGIETVGYQEKIKTNKTFAYMMYNDETKDYDEDPNRTEWPALDDYAYVKSVCYDGEGNVLKTSEVLKFDRASFTASVSTKTTLYCYLYFAPAYTPLGAFLKNSTEGTFETEADLEARNKELTSAGVATEDLDTLRRFVGTTTDVKDNFICFGTSDQSECLENLDLYMYRIIGLDNKTDEIKVIKATKIVKGKTYKFSWHNDQYVDKNWFESDIYKYLNDSNVSDTVSENYFIGNPYYNYMREDKWVNLIVSHPTWYYGNVNSNTTIPKTSYLNERSQKSNSNTNSVGMMYLSDYLYAGPLDTTNWLFIQNGLRGELNTGTPVLNGELQQPTSESEWTMTRFGLSGNTNRVRDVADNGSVSSYVSVITTAVRPAFYLNSGLKLGGHGKIDDPYVISN